MHVNAKAGSQVRAVIGGPDRRILCAQWRARSVKLAPLVARIISVPVDNAKLAVQIKAIIQWQVADEKQLPAVPLDLAGPLPAGAAKSGAALWQAQIVRGRPEIDIADFKANILVEHPAGYEVEADVGT